MENLKERLELHNKWLNNDKDGIRLYLSGADLSNADLRSANLSNANLRSADLSNVDLSGADLSNADLRSANLSGANLSNVDLSNANLSGAGLSNANLSGANLRYCIGNNKEVKSLQIGAYLISYTKDILNIGCQSHTLDKWKNFYNDDILSMDGEVALDWWSLNKDIIISLVSREAN